MCRNTQKKKNNPQLKYRLEIRSKIKNVEVQIENAKKIKGQYFFPALQKVLEKLKELESRYAKQNACAAKQNEICEICGGMQDKTRELKNSHTDGKLHQGYLRFRDELEIAESKMKEMPPPSSSSYSMGSSSSVSCSRSYSSSESRSRSRSRHKKQNKSRSRTISRSRSRS